MHCGRTAQAAMFALVDCNNFYASCERVFNPKLENKPVVVLSNNDGCIIARSNEAKQLGIVMGAPYFKHKQDLERHNVAVFSSNYELYGDMSARVMEVLLKESSQLEVYSVDEAFINLKGINNYEEFAQNLRQLVKRSTGIPVSIGIGPTKTLAKVANHSAKKKPEHKGVCCLVTKQQIEQALENFPIGEVWGIGRAWRRFCNEIGIETAADFAGRPDDWIRQNFHVVGLRTAWELRGTSCIPFNQAPPAAKGIAVTRCFSQRLTDIDKLQEALLSYTARAAEKMRKEKLAARHMLVFIHTSPHAKQEPLYYKKTSFTLPYPTNNTLELIPYTVKALKRIYQPGHRYMKGGIEFTDLVEEDHENLDIFIKPTSQKDTQLMKAIDRLNLHYGRNKVFFAGMGINREWVTARNMSSQRFTTRMDELIRVQNE